MPVKKNPGVVYNGSIKNVGRRVSQRKFCTASKRPPTKQAVHLFGGPLAGHTVYLADTSCTLPITMAGQTGRYVGNTWEAA